MHGFDPLTPVEETLRALEDLVRAGKVRYLGCSNYSGWHLMKSLAVSDREGLSRYVAHQAYYSLIAREYEWELQPLAQEERVGTLVWSPLSGGWLSGKVRRGQPLPEGSRLRALGELGPPLSEALLYRVLDALEVVSRETGKTVSQVAINWLLTRPTVASVILGARNEQQLRENLGAVGWTLSAQHVTQLDTASRVPPIYPYWHQQATFSDRRELVDGD